jgi:hypothetical protein
MTGIILATGNRFATVLRMKTATHAVMAVEE